MFLGIGKVIIGKIIRLQARVDISLKGEYGRFGIMLSEWCGPIPVATMVQFGELGADSHEVAEVDGG